MKWFKVVVWSLLIVPAILILCFGPRPGGETPPGRVVVDYWEKWTADEESQMRQIVDEFNRTVGAEKNIFVRYVSTSNVNQKTLVATAAGVPPDIAGLWNDNLSQFAWLDALEPLEDLATAHGITADTYKKVYWDALHVNGHLVGLISTPAAVALHYNKKLMAENADKLRAAGLDPTRPPVTLDELDKYAEVMNTRDSAGHILQAGYLPTEPGWYINFTYLWFGADIWDETTHRFTLTDPKVVKAFEWVQSYVKKLGKEATSEFQNAQGNFDSPQNSFLSDKVVMEQQGPWMANYIYNLKPSLSTVVWPRDVEMTKPLKERLINYTWAVEAFPSAVPGLTDVTYAGFDALVIPRGSKHKAEAFEFIAYVNRQDVMEKLNSMHCKNSPLRKVSDDFLNHHPNPYIGVFERLASSPNAHVTPQVPIWPETAAELSVFMQKLNLLEVEPKQGLEELQVRLQAQYESFMEKQRARHSVN